MGTIFIQIGQVLQKKQKYSGNWLGDLQKTIWAMVKSRVFLGMGNLPPLIGFLLMGPYKPLLLGWWVYPLLYGNNGSLDPGTFDKQQELLEKWGDFVPTKWSRKSCHFSEVLFVWFHFFRSDTSWKTNMTGWKNKNNHLKMYLLLKMVIFHHCHASFFLPGGYLCNGYLLGCPAGTNPKDWFTIHPLPIPIVSLTVPGYHS